MIRKIGTIYNTTLSATSQRHFSDSLGGGNFVCLKYRDNMIKTNVKMIDASYTTPTVSVVSLEFEGCLCGSFGRTTSSDPDDFEYGGKF